MKTDCAVGRVSLKQTQPLRSSTPLAVDLAFRFMVIRRISRLRVMIPSTRRVHFFSMPVVAISELIFVLQQARVTAPQLVHLCVATDCFALPTPTTAQSVPQPLQPWRDTDFVSGVPLTKARAPPLESVSRTWTSWSVHLAHNIGLMLLGSTFAVIPRLLSSSSLVAPPFAPFCALTLATLANKARAMVTPVNRATLSIRFAFMSLSFSFRWFLV
jgi:hypothetical protein